MMLASREERWWWVPLSPRISARSCNTTFSQIERERKESLLLLPPPFLLPLGDRCHFPPRYCSIFLSFFWRPSVWSGNPRYGNKLERKKLSFSHTSFCAGWEICTRTLAVKISFCSCLQTLAVPKI